MTFESYYNGAVLTVLIGADGRRSIENLVRIHSKNITKELARADALIRQLADTSRLRPPDQFRQESEGFWAIRAVTIRVYGWYAPGGKFVISHVISKRQNKLSDTDKARMQKNKKLFDAANGEKK